MRYGLAAALVALALLAIVCVPPVETGCGCEEATCGSDCRTPCCVASGAPFLAGAPASALVALRPMEPTFEAASAPRSADPRGILHVPKARS